MKLTPEHLEEFPWRWDGEVLRARSFAIARQIAFAEDWMYDYLLEAVNNYKDQSPIKPPTKQEPEQDMI